jgi:hypothetical protein
MVSDWAARGPRRLASLARSAWAVAQPTGSQAPPAAGHGGGYGTGRGGGKGAAGLGAHQGTAREVGLAGGWLETTNLAAETVGFRRVIRDGDGDSGHGGSIPSAGR